MLKPTVSSWLVVLLVFQIFAGVLFLPPIYETSADPGWYDTDWNYRVKLTIQASQVDADLTDFPIYIDLGNLHAGFHTNVNQTDARDIRVTKADGTTELPREVVVYDSTTDTGELHTKYSGVLSSSSDTEIYIYYGNGSASDYAVDATYGRNNVWESAAKMVQHLSENPAGGEPPDGSDEVFDSTSNSNDGNTGGTMTSGDQVTGQIDGSVEFEGTDDYVDCGNDSSLNITEAITIEAWVKPNGASEDGYVIAKGNPLGSANRYNLYWNGACNRLQMWSSGSPVANSNTVFTDSDTWVHCVITISGTSVIFYRNGVAAGTGSFTMSSNSDDLYLSNRVGGTSALTYFNGAIDEVRIYNRALAVDEISTQYNNQSSPSIFYSLGIEEKKTPVALTSWSYRKEIVIAQEEVKNLLEMLVGKIK